MRDVREGAAVDEGRVVFQRLHQVRLHRVFQQNGHCAFGLDVAAVDRGLVAAVSNDDVTQTLFQVFQVVGQAQDRHDFGRHGDVKTSLTREAVRHAAQARR